MENYRQTIKDTFEQVAGKDYLVSVELFTDNRYCAHVKLYPNRIKEKEIQSFWFVSPEDPTEDLTKNEIWWVRHFDTDVSIGGRFHFNASEPNRFNIEDFKTELKNVI